MSSGQLQSDQRNRFVTLSENDVPSEVDIEEKGHRYKSLNLMVPFLVKLWTWSCPVVTSTDLSSACFSSSAKVRSACLI